MYIYIYIYIYIYTASVLVHLSGCPMNVPSVCFLHGYSCITYVCII